MEQSESKSKVIYLFISYSAHILYARLGFVCRLYALCICMHIYIYMYTAVVFE